MKYTKKYPIHPKPDKQFSGASIFRSGGWLDNPEDDFLTNLINQKQTTSVDNTKVSINPSVSKQNLQPELAQLWDSDALKSKQVYDQKLAEGKKQTTVFDKERDSKTLAQNYLNKGNVDRQAFTNEQGVQTGQADVMAGLDDPILNTLTFGAAGTIGKVGMLAKTLGAARGGLGGATYGISEIPGLAYGLTKAGLTKGVETLGNTYKVNPWAENLNNVDKSYRVAGLSSYDDFLKTGVVRSKTILPENPTMLDRLNARPTSFPSFQKGYADLRYLPEKGGVIYETELPVVRRGEVNPITGNKIGGRHYAHRAINPETGKVLTEIPAEQVKVFGDKPHWLRGYQELTKPSIQASKPGVKIGVTGRPIVEKQFTAAVENAPTPNKWLNTSDSFGTMEQGVVKGPPSTQESVMKSFTGKEPQFKSEIDWAKWNKEIPDNKSLVDEYNSIEQSSKANNTWMKNADGSAFQGTPEQFVQQNSENFKKAFPHYYGEILNHNTNAELNTIDEYFFNKGAGDTGYYGKGTYTHPKKDYTKMYGKNNYEFYLNSKNKGFLDKSNIDDAEYFKRSDDEILQHHLPEYENKLMNYELDPSRYYDNAKENWLNKLNEQVKAGKISRDKLDEFTSLHNPKNGEVVIPFNNRVKSAIGNNGMFDMTNPNIYKTVIPGVLGTAALANEKKYGGWLDNYK